MLKALPCCRPSPSPTVSSRRPVYRSPSLTTLEWNRPDVIVSQEDVPELDGYELCSIIRSDPSTKALPFLLLTGPAGPPAGAPTRAGVDLVLGGTFDASDVTNRVQRLVSLGRSPCPRS